MSVQSVYITAIPSLPLRGGASGPGVSISVRKVLYLQITWHRVDTCYHTVRVSGRGMETDAHYLFSYMHTKDDFLIHLANLDTFLGIWRKIDDNVINETNKLFGIS